MVSISVSPFFTDDEDAEKLSISAAKASFGKFEGYAGAGRVFEEYVGNSYIAQVMELF